MSRDGRADRGSRLARSSAGRSDLVPESGIPLSPSLRPSPLDRGIAPVLTGTVNSDYEAVVRLRVRGPSGRDLETEAIIDTGFTGSLTLPKEVVTRLGLLFQGHERGV